MKKLLPLLLFFLPALAFAQLPDVNDTVKVAAQGAAFTPSMSFGFYNGDFIPYLRRGTSNKWDFYPSGAYLRKYFSTKTDVANLLPFATPGDILQNTGGNQYIGNKRLLQGRYILTDGELAAAKTETVSQSTIYNSFKRFSHGGKQGSTPMDLSTAEKNNLIPGQPSQTNSWSYDAVAGLFNSTFNSGSTIGLVSNDLYDSYVHNVTLGANIGSFNDNDRVGVVIGYVEDPSDMVPNNAYGLNPADFNWPIDVTSQFVPNQHSLILYRARDSVVPTYFIVYDYGKLDETIIANGTHLAGLFNTNNNWEGNTVDVKVIKQGDSVKVYTSQYSDAPGGKGALGFEMKLDLNSNPLLAKFKGKVAYGYTSQSQNAAFFENIYFNKSVNDIYDLRNGDVWVYNGTDYVIDPARNAFDDIGVQRYVFNPSSKKYIYIDENKNVQLIASPGAPADSTNFSEGITKTGNSVVLGGSFENNININNSTGASFGITSSTEDYLGTGKHVGSVFNTQNGYTNFGTLVGVGTDFYGGYFASTPFSLSMTIQPALANKAVSLVLDNNPTTPAHYGITFKDDFTKKGIVGNEYYGTNAPDLALVQAKFVRDTLKNVQAGIDSLNNKILRPDLYTTLYTTDFSSIGGEFTNPGGWTTTTGGVTTANYGLANYLFLNRPYGLSKRMAKMDIVMGAATVFRIQSRITDAASSVGTIFEVNGADNTIKIYNPYAGGATLPAVLITKPYTFISGHKYTLYAIRDEFTNKITVVDDLSGVSVTLADDTKNSGRQEDGYAFSVASGGFPVVSNFGVYAKTPIGADMLYFGDSILGGVGVDKYSNTFGAKLLNDLNQSGDVSGRPGGIITGVIGRVMSEAKYIKPKYVFVLIGTNGSNTTTNIGALVDSIRSIGAEAILSNIPWKNNDASFTSTTNTNLQSVRTSKGVSGVSMDVATSVDYLNTAQNTALFNVDGIHPNSDGHQQMYLRAKQDLKNIIQQYDSYATVTGTRLNIGGATKMYPTFNAIGGSPLIIERNLTSIAGPSIFQFKSRGTKEKPTATAFNDVAGGVEGFLYTGTGYYQTAAVRLLSAETNTTPTAAGSRIAFLTTPIGTASQAQERMSFTDYGGLQLHGSAAGFASSYTSPGLLAIKDNTTYNGISFHLSDGTLQGSIKRIAGGMEYNYASGGAQLFKIGGVEYARFNNLGLTATQLRLSALNTAPATLSDAGTLGEIRVTSSNIYVCIATNTWVKAPLSSFDYAPINNPNFTGHPTAPTQPPGTSNSDLATTGFASYAIAHNVDMVITKTADYTVIPVDFNDKPVLDVYVNASAGNVTITLPYYPGYVGYVVSVIKTDASANTVTVNAQSSPSGTEAVLNGDTITTQYQAKEYHSAPSIGWINRIN